ncbi:PIR protein [Plasmodium yoelii]|uniref:PIR protein n=2 Tax=Plasmodium yoelii TaxID=5861 RepID=A0AAE9WLD2_PLAYO|nr:PIR protein [Plasmodium yoelii]WBY56182.1 PIR protein [Plasmodium yoelii yoelii]CDS44348.1 YIR protein [Plasmodium yoelii]VTZ76119.1 PIR protein [Plasmodium yoelii]|eukprot:XP_022810771.1 PIR protein [Plasmodium yoelii]
MDKRVCGILLSVRNSFSDKLDSSGNYHFTMNEGIFKGYCNSNECDNNLKKINAGYLYLLDAFFEDNSVFSSVAKSNINIVDYIMIWLSYVLNLIKNEFNNSLQFFYDTYIKGDDKYKKPIANFTGYSSYKELIEKKNLMSMNIKDISKLYNAFTELCTMHLEFNEEKPDCGKYLTNANNFVEKYKKLKADSSITENSSYNQLLSTLSKDYDNFKNKCSDINCSNISSFPSIEITNNAVLSSQQFSEVTSSSSSISKNLFIVLSIFGAIGFFLGISYKYSLFGFRKRFQKQKLREKLKNIKKRMNH